MASARESASTSRPAPRGAALRDWALFAGGALAIFATVPFVRALEAWVVATAGAQAFLVAVLGIVAVAAAFAWHAVARLGARARVALLAGVAIYAGTAWQLRGNPVEAVHVVEYGALGMLALRALSHRGRDAALAPTAALLAASVGAFDEVLQWLAPDRVGDLRDVAVNGIAAAGGPALLALGVAPDWARARPALAARRRLLAVLAVAWALLGALCLNTSARVAWAARVVPGLGALAAQETGIVDYGELHLLPGVGAFPSRLSAADWEAADRARAEEAGGLLAENVRASAAAAKDAPGPYEAFLAAHSAVADPFLHELRAHVFRRDRYLETADAHRDDPSWRARDTTVAVRENTFLERFAPSTLRAGGLAWSAAERTERSRLDLGTPYRSRVAEAVVTRVRERHVALAWTLGGVLLGAAALRQWRRSLRDERWG
jgi:hypothetical protein